MTALRLEPWERFMLLSHAIDDVDPTRAAPLLPLVASAACVVIRLQQGKATQAEALAAIERARVACGEARRA